MEALLASPAAQLFLDRARSSARSSRSTPANARWSPRSAAASTASRWPSSSPRRPSASCRRTSSSTSWPTGWSSPAPRPRRSTPPAPRGSATCATAMDWSIGLLGEPVLRLYRRLGGDRRDVRALDRGLDPGARRAAGHRARRIDVGDGLRQLVDASLLRTAGTTGEFEMLTDGPRRCPRPARPERRGASRSAGPTPTRCSRSSRRPELDFPTDREMSPRPARHAHDDIREALEWATQEGDGTFALRLAGALAEFWRTRGHLTEGRLRLAAALAIGDEAPSAVRRKALAGAGLLASYQGDYTLGDSYLREVLAVADLDGDDEARATILNWLGTNAYGGGNLDEAETFIAEAVAIRRRLDDSAGIATALNALGGVYHFRGDLDRARETFAESLALKQELGNPNGIAVSLTNLGLVERDAGRPDVAVKAFEEAIAIWERTGYWQRAAVGIHNAALVALDLAWYDVAADMLQRSYDIARELRRPDGDGLRPGGPGPGRGGAGQPLRRGLRAGAEPATGGLGRRAGHHPAAARGRRVPRGRARGGPRRRPAVGRRDRGAHELGVREHASRRAASRSASPRCAPGSTPRRSRMPGRRALPTRRPSPSRWP